MTATFGVEGEPFYFGADASLLGVHHAPLHAPGRSCGVVICNPFGHEYIRAHRALRQLAVRLARAGFHTLRFDYYGCGDSVGSDESGTIMRWLADISAAIDELRRRSGAPCVSLVGLRLGASLSAQVAAERKDVASLVLWEPVVNGQAYLDQLKEFHQEKIWYFLSKASSSQAELVGFPLTESMRADLERLDLLSHSRKPADTVLVIEGESDAFAQRLDEHLTQSGVTVLHQHVPSPRIWTEDPDKGLVPHQTLQAIVTWLTGACA